LRHFARAVYAVVVCLSVSPSITSWYYSKMAKPRITKTTLHNNVETSFLLLKILLKFE